MIANPRPALRRILMTADGMGGVWGYALTLIRQLTAERHEVLLATMGAPLTDDQRQEAAEVPRLQLAESAFRLEWMDEPWEDVATAGRWLHGLARDYQPDLVHLNGYAHGVQDWPVPVLMVGHSCVLSWWQAVKGQPAPGTWQRYAAAVDAGLRRAAGVVAPTRAMAAWLRTYYPHCPPVTVIPNAVEAALYSPAVKEELVFGAGRIWDEAKNLAALQQVAPSLPWPAYLAGDARRPDGHVIEMQGMRLLGRLSTAELRQWYARAAIYALPAKYEPFGLSVLEAALSGCALVLGDIPTLRELWEGAALFVPPDQPRLLHECLSGLIAQPEARRCWGERARARGKSFSLATHARAYCAVYERMLHARAEARVPDVSCV